MAEAEYVGGYVCMVAEDGYMYVAEQDDLSTFDKVCYLNDMNIVGMAMNYADGKTYVMTQADGTSDCYQMTISTMDLITGEFTALYDVEVINPYAHNKTRTRLYGLAIDDSGNFYTVNYGTGTQSFLYTWTNAQAAEGKITALYPINNAKNGGTGFYGNYSSLAWDHDKDILYMAAITSMSSSSSNMLCTLDTATGKGTKTSDTDGGYGGEAYKSQLRLGLTGLYIVPGSSPSVSKSDTPYAVELDQTELNLLTGATLQIHADIYPWSMEDKSPTWTTSDPNVAIVDEDGNVTTVGAGTAVITATTNATPAVSDSCTVNVTVLEDVKLSGLIYDVDSSTYWSEFVSDELPSWTAVSAKASFYIAGTLKGEKIYVHDGGQQYSLLRQKLGETGLNLSGVSAVTGGVYASMEYDEASGYLMLSTYTEGDIAVTNGLVTVDYDADLLALESIVINGTYTAKVNFGYVSLTGIAADETLTTLTFSVKEAKDSVITVVHRQENNEQGTTQVVPVELKHENTDPLCRGARLYHRRLHR